MEFRQSPRCADTSLYQQTVARLWRQGQTSGTVVVQHIVTENTVDERILAALQKKDFTQAALIEAVKADIFFNNSGRNDQ